MDEDEDDELLLLMLGSTNSREIMVGKSMIIALRLLRQKQKQLTKNTMDQLIVVITISLCSYIETPSNR